MPNFKKKKKRPKLFIGDVEWNWKWSKNEKEQAKAIFFAEIIELSEWLKTDPKLSESLRRIKHPNGLYGVEIVNER